MHRVHNSYQNQLKREMSFFSFSYPPEFPAIVAYKEIGDY